MLRRLQCARLLRQRHPLLDTAGSGKHSWIGQRILVEQHRSFSHASGSSSSSLLRSSSSSSSSASSPYYQKGLAENAACLSSSQILVSGGDDTRNNKSLLFAATASLLGLTAVASSYVMMNTSSASSSNNGNGEHSSSSTVRFFGNSWSARCDEKGEDDKNKVNETASNASDHNLSAAADPKRTTGSMEESSSSEPPDPYDNLPETDEETNCSMCNTFRKGPCRPFWRKLERCFKDNEKEENGAVKCMRYFTPHQQCLQQYINLYQLVSLDMKQELVRDAELAVRDDERREWQVDIDWGLWKDFVKEQGPGFKQTVRRTSKDNDDEGNNGDASMLPLWQRLPENLEPVLLTVSSPLPQQKDNMILKIAYAVDQDGFVVGFAYNQAYQALVELSTKKNVDDSSSEKVSESVESEQTTEKATVSDENGGKSPPSPQDDDESVRSHDDTFSLEFFLLPGETKSIRISAMYSENPVNASPEKDLLDVILCTSPAYSVAEGAAQ